MASSYQHKRKREATAVKPSQQKKTKKHDILTCFFCNKTGQVKKDCVKYATWRAKKGMILAFVCSEVNLSFAPMDTWWVWSQPPSDVERFIYVADDNKVVMEVVETFRLCFKTRFFFWAYLRHFVYRLLDGI